MLSIIYAKIIAIYNDYLKGCFCQHQVMYKMKKSIWNTRDTLALLRFFRNAEKRNPRIKYTEVEVLDGHVYDTNINTSL